MKEFATAVRKDLAIGDDIITDAELESLFKQVDVDGGGEVDAEEFVQWLQSARHPAKTRGMGILDLFSTTNWEPRIAPYTPTRPRGSGARSSRG